MLFNLLSALPDGEERAEEEVIARDVATVAYAGIWLISSVNTKELLTPLD